MKARIQLLCKNIVSLGNDREGSVSPSKVFNLAAERVKGNLPLCNVYSLVLGLHGLDSQSGVCFFFLSCPSNPSAINGKSSTEENTDNTDYFMSATRSEACPHFANLHYSILSKQLPLSLFMDSQVFYSPPPLPLSYLSVQ